MHLKLLFLPVDKVKCVGVFPSALTQREAKLIENIFTVMKSSAQRSEPILETINPEDVLDILYGTWTSVNEIQAAQQDSARPVNNIQTQSRGPPSQMPTASQMLQTTTQMARPPASMARGWVGGIRVVGCLFLRVRSTWQDTRIGLVMRPANERRRYIVHVVTTSLIGWVHT